MRTWFIALLSVLLIATVGAIGGFVWVLRHYGDQLPDHRQLAEYRPPIVTRVHAGDGRLLAELAAEKRVFVPIALIPAQVKQAFISAEDKNFYTHPGIDAVGLGRAMVQNLGYYLSGRRLIGASTITQQVTRSFLLTNERSIDRKIKEMILSIRIEQALTKDQILELYLNEIYLGSSGGSGAYGVAAAALMYFNKSLDQLTLSEAAFLAALPKAPSNYNLSTHAERARIRRDYVIDRMLEDGFVTVEEVAKAKEEVLTVRRREADETVKADYFAEEVRRELVARYGEEGAYRGGYMVRASLDPRLQEIADRTFRNGLIRYDRRHGWRGPLEKAVPVNEWQKALAVRTPPGGAGGWNLALVLKVTDTVAEIGVRENRTETKPGKIPLSELTWARPVLPEQKVGAPPKKVSEVLTVGDLILVEPVTATADGKTKYPAETYGLRQLPDVSGGMVVMDPHTGRVLALVGGLSFDQSQFNRATQAKRQPGSSFKPFVYMAALENGYTPASVVLDAPFVMDDGSGKKWRPENYTEKFYGPSSLRLGIEQSRNLMTIRLASAIGMEKVVDIAGRFGITDSLPPLLSMSLGAGESTPLKMAAAYAMIANGGEKLEPTVIDRVQDRYGQTVFKHDPRVCDGCSAASYTGGLPPYPADNRPQVIDAATAFQMTAMLEGVVQRGTGGSIGAALKRPLAGKTGTSNDSFDNWFVGYSPDLVVAAYIGFDQPRTLGKAETGGGNMAPIFRDFMKEALEGVPPIPFRVPPGLRMVRVNRETGKLATVGDPKAIFEAFKPGTEPGADDPDNPDPLLGDLPQGYSLAPIPGSENGAFDPAAPVTAPAAGDTPAPPPPAPANLGGIY
ncbi:MAG: penicillin-binding protein 1A [Elstera sp.]